MPLYYRQLQALVESADSPLKLIASLHVCLESFAMGAFEYRRSACRDPRILAMGLSWMKYGISTLRLSWPSVSTMTR